LLIVFLFRQKLFPVLECTGWAKKRGPQTYDQFCQFLTDLRNFFTGRFFGKFAVKWISTIPPHLEYIATLPCETLISAKQAINDKLQGMFKVWWGS